MRYFLAGCLYWFCLVGLIYTGFATPTETFVLGIVAGFPVAFIGSLRSWPWTKLAFMGWGPLTALFGLLVASSEAILVNLGICQSLSQNQLALGCVTGGNVSEFLLQNYLYALVAIITLIWIFVARRLSNDKPALWKLVVFSPAFVVLVVSGCLWLLLNFASTQG